MLSELPQGRALMMGRATDDHRAFLQGLKAEVAAAGLSNRILFRDEVPIAQLAAHFQALDLYVAPQRWEGFGLTPLEAMACGTPVVATRVGAFEDLIADGVTGHLVEVGDADAIASHVRELIANADQRTAFGSAARQRVVAEFSIEREATALVDLYRALLDG